MPSSKDYPQDPINKDYPTDSTKFILVMVGSIAIIISFIFNPFLITSKSNETSSEVTDWAYPVEEVVVEEVTEPEVTEVAIEKLACIDRERDGNLVIVPTDAITGTSVDLLVIESHDLVKFYQRAYCVPLGAGKEASTEKFWGYRVPITSLVN